LVLTFAFVTTVSAATPNWNITGTWTWVQFDCPVCVTSATHNMTITAFDTTTGAFSGTGIQVNDVTNTWTVSGNVDGDNINFILTTDPSSHYDGYILNASGTIAQDGLTMDGSGADNYSRTTPWNATGVATAITVPCATIESGTITDVKGNPITLGFDKYGYNYQAHMFNGFAGNYSRPNTLVTTGDKLIMKWSDSWIANVDCDHNGKLDRGLVDGQLTDGISKGWLTNHYTGIINIDGKNQKYTDFIKMGWVGPGGDLWGQYTILQEVWNDKSLDLHGLYSMLEDHGFGLNNQWTSIP